jgi:hypothetical protein
MIEETVDIITADGRMETFVCRPERGGPYPAVFFLMDTPGVREELREAGGRATLGAAPGTLSPSAARRLVARLDPRVYGNV